MCHIVRNRIFCYYSDRCISSVKEVRKLKTISINGHVLDKALMVDDPDVKRTFTDAAGNERHIRLFSKPAGLKSYIKKHPEGMILAGVGVFFFTEPVPVSSAMIRFDDSGSVEITVREGAEMVEEQLSIMENMRAAAEQEVFGL